MKRFIVPAAIAAILTFYAPAKGADNDPPCLTHEQAKEKYPGQWLYWRTARHCWYGNGRMQRTAHRTPRAEKPPVAIKTAAVVPAASSPAPSVYYPTLMAGGGTSNAMLAPWAMTTWPLVTDFDTEPPAFLPWSRVDSLMK